MGQLRKAILIVDDDPETRRLLLRLLQSPYRDIQVCGTGRQAIDLTLEHHFDLVLLDLGLPDGNGLDILARFKNEVDTRFLIVTVDDTPESLLQAVKDQAWGFVRKPFDRDHLADLVSDALVAPPVPPIEVISAKPDWFELSVPCSRDAVERVDLFMSQLMDVPENLRDTITQCFRELLMNAMEWGGKFDPSRRVSISYLRTDRMLQYRISDPGQGFSFENLKHAAVANSGDDVLSHTTVRAIQGMRAGGFGIMMVKAMADELLYNEKQNEVVFIKYLSPHV